MRERRLEGRLLCADMVEVEWTDKSGWLWITTALLEDICASGACLQTEKALPAGTELNLQYRGAKIAAKVRYCVFQEIGYFVGIEFSEGFRWSRRAFRPQHLLDLAQLAQRTKA
jgi:hypothetical protein